MYLFMSLSLLCFVVGFCANEEPQTFALYLMAAVYATAAVFEFRVQMILKRRIEND
jgi:hypothetical protein